MIILRAGLVIFSMAGMLPAAHGETVTRTVNFPDEITRVYLNGSNELHLTQGNDEYVKLTAPEEMVSRVEARVKGRSLYLGKEKNWGANVWDSNSSQNVTPVRFDVQLKRIDAIRIIGSGKAYTGDLVGDRLRIIMVGNARAVMKSIMVRDLKVEFSGSCDFKGDKIVAGESELRIGGSGKIDIAQLDTDALEIDIGGSGNVKLEKIIAAKLETKINGSGNLDLGGRAGTQDLEINGSGDYRAKDLVSDTAYIDIRGGGEVKVSVKKELTAELMKGANLVYYGGPELEADISGKGKFHKAGEITGD